ncbi:hypothetical protein [Simkania sp.]|uniref:hypothetical protein n=1 Tax=Simkania sp. TaxID=34094 RepID=UPI003B519E6E
MNNFKIRDLVPRPVREIIYATSDIQALAKKRGPSQTVESFLKCEAGQRATEEAQKMIRGALQIALFAGGFYAVRYMGWSVVTTGVLGSILSTASLVTGASFYGLAYGAQALLHCIGTGSFWHLASGIACVGGGYYALEHLEIFQIGVLDKGLVKLGSEKGAPLLLNHLL